MEQYPDLADPSRRPRFVDDDTAPLERDAADVQRRWAVLPLVAVRRFVDVKHGRLPYRQTWSTLERAALSGGAPERWTRQALYNAVAFAQVGREPEGEPT